MYGIEGKTGKISVERAMVLLKKDGIEVTQEQAEIILEFLYELGEIFVDYHLSNPSDSVYLQ